MGFQWLENVKCLGNESKLDKCVHDVSFTPGPVLEAGVICNSSDLGNSVSTHSSVASCKAHARQSGFRNLINVCLWNPESWVLESGIQLKESGIPLTIGIRNPSSTEKESGIQFLESGIHRVESRISRLSFDYLRPNSDAALVMCRT